MSERYTETLHLTVVSDYICPWCYIGISRVDRLAAEYDVAVEWVPFELRPGLPPEGISFDRLRGQGRYTEDYLVYVRDLAADAGIEMRERSFIPNSRPALEAAEWARDNDCFETLHRALFHAYFEDGLDIGSRDVLQRVAEGSGVDADAMVAALVDGRYSARLEEKLDWSRVAGEGGVPYYMFRGVNPEDGDTRRFAFTGAQDYLVFRQVAERLGARPRADG